MTDQQHRSHPKADSTSVPIGMSASRKLRGPELRLLILWLLENDEAYGTELADEIEQLSAGFYRPSSGVIYPRVAELDRDGLVEMFTRGRRKYCRITSSGRDYLEQHRADASSVQRRLARAGRKYVALREAMAGVIDDGESLTPIAHGQLEARLDLKAALRDSLTLDAEKQRSVTRILQDAADAIRELSS